MLHLDDDDDDEMRGIFPSMRIQKQCEWYEHEGMKVRNARTSCSAGKGTTISIIYVNDTKPTDRPIPSWVGVTTPPSPVDGYPTKQAMREWDRGPYLATLHSTPCSHSGGLPSLAPLQQLPRSIPWGVRKSPRRQPRLFTPQHLSLPPSPSISRLISHATQVQHLVCLAGY